MLGLFVFLRLMVAFLIHRVPLRTILSALFDNLEKSFSYKEVQLNTICLPVKTSYFLLKTLMKILLSITLYS